MLHRYIGMFAGDRRRRTAVVLLLVNVSLIIVAAVWRHAAADDPELARQDLATPSAAVPQVELPPADEAHQPATPPATAAIPADDAVMDELRKVIRDPSSGLDIPRLDETSPLTTRATGIQRGDSEVRLQRRMETVHALSAAALSLVREARSLSDAGQTAESTELMQHAAELRQMIAALAARSNDQP